MSSRGLVWSGSVLAVLAVAAVGGAYWKYPDFFQPPTVTTGVAVLGPVSEAVYGTGTVEPERWAKVVPLQRRRLIELCRCEGQAVKAGQVLGRQDDAEEVSALHELEINNEQLTRDLDRASRDRDKSEAAKTEYEQRSTQFEQSKSRISAQKTRIDSLVLRAPLDGMVLRRDGEVGEIVGPTEVLFWVGPPTPMQVVAEINEEEITRIAAGQKAFLRSEAFSAPAMRSRSSVAEKFSGCLSPSGFEAAVTLKSSATCRRTPPCCHRHAPTWPMARGSAWKTWPPSRRPPLPPISLRFPVLRLIARPPPPWLPVLPMPTMPSSPPPYRLTSIPL